MNTATQNQKSEMKNYLYFAGTIYDSFEALEEVLGKLKLERPLFLLLPQSQIKFNACHCSRQLQ